MGSHPLSVRQMYPWLIRMYQLGRPPDYRNFFLSPPAISAHPAGARRLGSGLGLGFGLVVRGRGPSSYSVPHQRDSVCPKRANEALECPSECSRFGGPPSAAREGREHEWRVLFAHPRPTLAYQTVMGGSTSYLGALVAYPLSPHGREVWNRQGQVTLRVANPVVGHSMGNSRTRIVRCH